MRIESAIKRKRLRKSIFNYFTEYTNHTSIHGLKYLGGTNTNIVEKIWWIISFSASLLICGYLIYEVWIKWQQNPVFVTFGETETSITQIPFPAITVCSSEKFLISKYNYSHKCNETLNAEELFKFQSVSLLCKFQRLKGTCKNEQIENPYTNESAIDVMKKVLLMRNDIILDLRKNKSKHYFRPILTSQGNCFTYNLLDINEIFRKDVVNINYIYGDVPMNEWTLDNGYFKNASYPHRGKSSGLNGAFKFILKRNESEAENFCSGNVKGYKISIHSPSLLPPVDDDFIWIPLNSDNMISIEPQLMKIDPGLANYDYQRRQCYFYNERYLRFFKSYSQENCLNECLTNYTIQICECVTFSMPHTYDIKICTRKKMNCVYNAKKYLYKMINERNENNEPYDSNRNRNDICNCLPACRSLKYKKINSHISNQNHKVNPLRDKTTVKVYFDSSYFIMSKRTELYGTVDFLANCGGLMGVCLGFSILSLVEIIYFLTLRCYYRIKLGWFKTTLQNNDV